MMNNKTLRASLVLCLLAGLFSFIAQTPSPRAVAETLRAAPASTALSESATNEPAVLLPVLDPAFAPRFEVEGTVRALAIQPDNKIIIAGAFDTVNGQAYRNIARLNPDGSLDLTFALSALGIVPTPDFYAVALLPDGKILVGGAFNLMGADGRFRYCLARLNSDGTLDEAFFAGNYTSGGLDSTVHAILVQPDGRILIGGAFTQILGSPRQRIARLNVDGSVDTTFDPGAGANDTVLTLARQTDGKIIIGGAFTAFAGVAAARIARLNADGSRDVSFNVSANDVVNTVAVQSDGAILLGGAFTTVNGQGRTNLARVQPGGDLDALTTYMFYEVKSVLVLPDNSIIVGGWYTSIIFENWPMYHDARLARIDSAGVLVSVISFDGKPTEVLSLAQRADGQVVAGGCFRNLTIYEGQPVTYRHSLIAFSPTLQIVSDFQPIVASAGKVRTILPLADGNWMALGNFSLVNGAPHIAAARINSAGVLDTTFIPPFRRPSNTLNSGVLLDDGSFLLGGDFTDNYTDQDLIGQTLVRLSPQGALLAFPRIAVSLPVLALDAAGKILVGGGGMGNFHGIIRLLPDGQLDTTFDPGEGLSGYVEADGTPGRIHTILVQANDQIVVAGKFSNYNNEGRSAIVRLQANGAVDASFVPPVFGTRNPVHTPVTIYALAQQGEQILVGGSFSTTDGVASYYQLARLQPNGALDPTFAAFFKDNGGAARVLTLLPDNSILVGGSLQAIVDGKIYNNLFHLLPGGARQPTFTSSVEGARQAFVNGAVHTIAVGPGEQMLIGGNFIAIEGAPRSSLGSYQLQSLVSAYIDPVNGGEMHAPADGVSYIFPSGAFTETVILVHSPCSLNTLPATGELASNGLAFDVTAIYSSTGQLAQLAPGTHFTLTIEPLTKGPLIPGTLALWWWDESGAAWSQAGIISAVDTAQQRMTAQVDHLSLFAVLGETRRVYLPLVLK